MKKLNKVLFGFGTVAAVVAPVAAVVACDNDSPKTESVVNAKSAKILAASHIAMWENVEWKDDAHHETGVKLITGKTDTEVKTSVNAFFAEINKISSEIKWDKVKTIDSTNFAKDKKVIDDAIASLSAAKVNAATGEDLMQLAYRTNVLYQVYIPLVAISFGADSLDAQQFVITILEGHTSNGITVTDEPSYKDYVNKAKDTLETKLTLLSNIQ